MGLWRIPFGDRVLDFLQGKKIAPYVGRELLARRNLSRLRPERDYIFD